MSSNRRCYVPALAGRHIGGTGFQPVRPHRQDAGATKSFSEQSHMSRWFTHKL
jgi:hypothetical protein